MRELKRYNEESLLFYDIETASIQPEIKEGEPLYDSWAYKVNKTGEKTPDEIKTSFINEAALYPEFARVVSIVVGKIMENQIKLITFDDSDEKLLLTKFNDMLKRRSGDVLTGFVNTGFDTPFTFKRMIINGITPDTKLDISGLKPWEVEEIDLAKLWQATSFTRASLINVSTAFGLPSPKSDISGKDVSKHFWMGEINRISAYCRRDVITTINIFKKMKGENPFIIVNEDINIASEPVIIRLFNGAEYDEDTKNELKELYSNLNMEEKKKAVDILNGLISTARNRGTNFKKSDLKELQNEK